MSSILIEHKQEIAIITLNRPDSLNAFNYQSLDELSHIVKGVSQDQNIRCVVIRGQGKAFSVGADLKERITLNEDEVRRNVNKIRTLYSEIESLPQPTIAAMHGYAFGGGFELALACDLRYAHRDTLMGLTEVSLGIIPGAGGTIRLAQLVGKAKAKECILMAKKFQAEEALALGVVNDICDQNVFAFSVEHAYKISQMPPLAVTQAKLVIDKGYEVESRIGMEMEAEAYERLIPTEDRMEALRAFSEKRTPNFKGR